MRDVNSVDTSSKSPRKLRLQLSKKINQIYEEILEKQVQDVALVDEVQDFCCVEPAPLPLQHLPCSVGG